MLFVKKTAPRDATLVRSFCSLSHSIYPLSLASLHARSLQITKCASTMLDNISNRLNARQGAVTLGAPNKPQQTAVAVHSPRSVPQAPARWASTYMQGGYGTPCA